MIHKSYVIFPLLVWTNLALSNWELPTSVQREGDTILFCAEGVKSNDPFQLYVDDRDVTVDFADLLDEGEAGLYDYPSEMCLEVNKLEFSTSKTLSLWLEDQVATWIIPLQEGADDSKSWVDLESQAPLLSQLMTATPTPGAPCTINRTTPVLPCPGCPTATCGSWLDAPNPYPCCDNDVDGNSMGFKDGSCEWWAAYSARIKWGFYPRWGLAKQWRTWADRDKRVLRTLFRPGRAGLYLDPTKAQVAWATGLVDTNGMVQIQEMNCGRARYTGTWQFNKAGVLECSLPWSKIQPYGYSSGLTTRWVAPAGMDFVYKVTTNKQCATGVWTDVKGLIWNLYQNNQAITGTTDSASCGLYRVSGSLVGNAFNLTAVPAKPQAGCCNSSFEGTMSGCNTATVHFRNYCTGNHGDMTMTKRGL